MYQQTALDHLLSPQLPTANITIKRNKVKLYPQNQVFLEDKQEFEIELFNPTGNTQLAKISINGKPISSTGIVLKPGQRVYLERYIDIPKKFLFETYKVDSSPEAQAAIQQNGNIRVDFYDEYVYQNPAITWTNCFNSTAGGNYFTRTSTSSLSDNVERSASLMSKRSSAGGSSGGSSEKFATMDFMSSVPKEKETGRVEQGGHSNQNFTNYSGSFNSWISTTVYIKINPISDKPLEIKDLVQYCTNCGTKNKKGNYKYCPKCGQQF